MGVRTQFINIHPHPFGYSQTHENPLFAERAAEAVLRHRKANRLGRPYWAFRYLFNVFGLLLWSLNKFDVYVFAWGKTFLPSNLDLPLLSLLGKRIIVNVGHGSEARPPYMSQLDEPVDIGVLRKQTVKIAQKLRRIESWAHCVIGLPTTAQMLRNRFVNFYPLGLPVVQSETAIVSSADSARQKGKFRIVHLPSNPAVKGTEQIRHVIEVIRARNPEVEYIELSGVSHEEVLAVLEDCDLVIDQVWSDIPMAMVGAEAAIKAKPTVIGGYCWELWQRELTVPQIPPSIRCAPEDLTQAINDCIEDKAMAQRVGEQAQKFVSEHWTREAVAKKYIKLINNEIPAEWWYSPENVRYGFGGGVNRDKVLNRVSQLVNQYGWAALEWSNARSVYEPLIQRELQGK